MNKIMRLLLITIISFFLLTSIVFSSEETCYVVVDSSEEFNPALLSNISVSLISQFLKEVEPIPSEGVSIDSCLYQISVSKEKETTFVTFKGKNLNSYGDSKLSGTDGFQQSVLKSLYRSLRDKRKLICEDYGTLLEECDGVVGLKEAVEVKEIFTEEQPKKTKTKVIKTPKVIPKIDLESEVQNIGNYKNGFFIAITDNGNKFISENLISWDKNLKYDDPFYKIVYGNNIYVSIKVNSIYTSKNPLMYSNSKNWLKKYSTKWKSINGLAFGNELFIAVGDEDTILTSKDGNVWKNKDSNYDTAQNKGIAFGNNVFLVVGIHDFILRSIDGFSWSKISFKKSLVNISFGNEIFIALSADGSLYSSSNGFVWNILNPISEDIIPFSDLTFGNDYFVLAGFDGSVYKSKNGNNWEKYKISGNPYIKKIIFHPLNKTDFFK